MNKFIVSLYLIALSAISFAENRNNIDVYCLGIQQGLSHQTVNTIYEDEFGFVWIGTIDGLNRFDGKKIDLFMPNRLNTYSINTNVIKELYGDKKGHLFIRGQHSVSVYDMRSGRFNVLLEDRVSAITYKDGLWVATQDQVYYYKEPYEAPALYFSLKQGNSAQTNAVALVINYMCVDNNGILYLATNNNGLIRVDKNQNIHKYQINNISSIYCDSKNVIWITTIADGFYSLNSSNHLKNYCFNNQTLNYQDKNNVRTIVEGEKNNYYIATYDGLMLFDSTTEQFTSFSYQYDIAAFNSRAIRALHYCKGRLYMGTFHVGALYYTDYSSGIKIYSPTGESEESLSTPIVSSVYSDEMGVIWFGTISGGLNIIDKKQTISKKFKQQLISEPKLTNIKSFYYDEKKGVLWVGTFSEGIIAIDRTKEKIIKISPKIYVNEEQIGTAQNITKIVPVGGSDSLVMSSSYGGILLYDNKNLRLYDINSMLTPKPISYLNMTVEGDSNNTLWVTSSSYIYLIDIERMQTKRVYTLDKLKHLFGENIITDIFRDREGTIWLGSSGSGLFKYDRTNDTFINYNKAQGLDNSYINHIAQSRSNDNLFLATNDGIASFNTKSEKIINYNIRNGYPFTITDRLFTMKDSTIFACGLKGVTSIKEDMLIPVRQNYEVYIKSIYVNNKLVTPNDNTKILYSTPLYQKKINLGPQHSTISFEVVSNLFGNTSFEYMLEGFNDSFVPLLDNNVITYTNLNPGAYTLYVRGTIPDENGQFPDISIKIEVAPPFYKSWWFFLLVAVVVGTILSAILYHYMRGQRFKISLEKERLEKEHIEKVNKSKMDLFTKVSHEFRTPLTLINSYLDIILHNKQIAEEDYNNVMGAYNNVRQLNQLVDEFIDIRRMESVSNSVNLKRTDIVSCIRQTYSMFFDYAKNRGIEFTFDNTIDSKCFVLLDESMFSKAINNLLSNAFKYVENEKGRISIHISCTDEYVEISVSDNGIGIEPNNTERIFENFWQEERANVISNTKGSGIGLMYAKNIIEMHSGSISVSSIPWHGSVFTIKLPINSNQLIKSEMDDEDTENIQIMDDTEYLEKDDKCSILVVEDNTEMGNVLFKVLSSSYKVYLASNGQEGIYQAITFQPNLIISDVMMPDITGIELCSSLKSDFATSHIPIILLTALAGDSQVIEGLSSGADDYITKPFNMEVLLARCENIINVRKKLHEKYQRGALQNEKVLVKNPEEGKLLSDAVKIVKDNLDTPNFDLMIFARELGVSRTNLFNKIKALTGLTPSNFVITVKLKIAAEEILNSPDISISEISYKCGFSTPSHFAKCFKKTFGVTPLSYRKEHNVNI